MSDSKGRDYVVDVVEQAMRHSNMARVRDEWDRADKLMEGFRPKKATNEPNFWIPRTYSTHRAELSTITSAMFGKTHMAPFAYHPPDRLASDIIPDDAILQASLDTAFVSNQFRQMRGWTVCRNWFDDTLRYGTGIVKLAWRKHSETQFDEVPVLDPASGMPIPGVDGQPMTKPQPREVILANRPVIENVDLRNFFWDWTFDEIEDMDFVAQRKIISRQYLRDMGKSGIYKNVDGVLYAKTEESDKAIEEYSQQLRAMRGQTSQTTIDVKPDDPAFDKHAKVTIVELQRNDEFFTVALSPAKVLLRRIKNPFKHKKKTYIALRNIKRPKMFAGMGEPILTESLQNETNYLHNIAAFNLNLALNKQFIADRNADMDLDKLKSRPGNITLVSGNPRDSIMELPISEAGINGFQIMAAALNGAYEDATSVTSTFKGATPIRGETATTTSALLNQASTAIRFKFDEWFEEGMVPLAKMLQSMNRQFLNYEQTIKVTDNMGQEQWVAYQADAMDTDFPVYPVASVDDVFQNTELRQANFLRFMQVFGQPNSIFSPYIKPYGVLVEGFKSLGYTNIRPLAMTPDEMQEAQQYQQAYGQSPPGTPQLQLLQGGQGAPGNESFGQGQNPQNQPQPESAEDLTRSASTLGTQGPA